MRDHLSITDRHSKLKQRDNPFVAVPQSSHLVLREKTEINLTSYQICHIFAIYYL